jgi:hypothetical protein
MLHDRSRSEYELVHFLVPKTSNKNKREQMKNTLPLVSIFFSSFFFQRVLHIAFPLSRFCHPPSILISCLTIEAFEYAIRLAPASIQTSVKTAAPSISDFTDSRLTKRR